MSGIEAVLAAHEACLTSWGEICGCICGWDSPTGPSHEGVNETAHRHHVAEQVTAWVAERLAAPEMRTAVAEASEEVIYDHLDGHNIRPGGIPYRAAQDCTDAALAAVTAHLCGEAS